MFPEQPFGNIHIQTDTVTKLPEYFHSHFPSVQRITTTIDEAMNDESFMRSGIGDFADRCFETYTAQNHG